MVDVLDDVGEEVAELAAKAIPAPPSARPAATPTVTPARGIRERRDNGAHDGRAHAKRASDQAAAKADRRACGLQRITSGSGSDNSATST